MATMRALFGQLAQLVEQRIENPRVRGSIPRQATTNAKPLILNGVKGFLLLLLHLACLIWYTPEVHHVSFAA